MVVWMGLLFLDRTDGKELHQEVAFTRATGQEVLTYGCQSRSGGSPSPPPGSPDPRVRTRSDQGHRSSCKDQDTKVLFINVVC